MRAGGLCALPDDWTGPRWDDRRVGKTGNPFSLTFVWVYAGSGSGQQGMKAEGRADTQA